MDERHFLQPWFADAILDVFDAADAEGIDVEVTSTYRSSADQYRLRRAFIRRGKKGLPAAPPGQSFHEFGLAVDFVASPADAQRRVGQIAEEFGLRYGGFHRLKDPVHIDAAYQVSLREARRRFDVRRLVRV